MFEQTDWMLNTESVPWKHFLQILQNLEFTDANFSTVSTETLIVQTRSLSLWLCVIMG
jgi:hypothetical protein